MPSKPYKAKSLKGAQGRVRYLMRQREADAKRYHQLIGKLLERCGERKLLAMLAAEGPCFDNPLVIAEAKAIRDRVLRDECNLNPDGSFITA